MEGIIYYELLEAGPYLTNCDLRTDERKAKYDVAGSLETIENDEWLGLKLRLETFGETVCIEPA